MIKQPTMLTILMVILLVGLLFGADALQAARALT
jgi:hypothetical protein